MYERQLIFESVLPSELDPARFSKPIIDGVEQPLTSNENLLLYYLENKCSIFF
jgi:hypothetical protein